MDSEEVQQAKDASAAICNVAESELRNRYPYLKTEALSQILNKMEKLVEDEVANQEPVMAASRARINFFSLSAELRNYIYELALVEDGPVYDDPLTSDCSTTLLQVSRQIRAEAAPIYYGSNAFVFTVSINPNSFSPIRNHWLNVIGKKQAAFIRNITIKISIPSFGMNDDEEDGRRRDLVVFVAALTLANSNCLLGETTRADILKALGVLGVGVKEGVVRIQYEGIDGGYIEDWEA